MIRFIINQATKISVANEYEQEIFSNFNAGSKTVIIRNGINLDELDWGEINFKKKHNIPERFILFLGRFNKVKGIDILLLALNLIKNKTEMINVKLVIMGVDFGFESEMLEMISKLNLVDKTIVIKRPKREEVIAAYRECEFLVLPSRWELSPLTPLEGFAFKKAVISTNAHGIPFTVKNNENAILVEPENYCQLANAIIDLLNDDKKRSEYGQAGYEQVEKTCNSRIMVDETLRLYEEVLKHN
jgi:glycosyltransferase involved in cell wall biosynthesis